MRPNRFSKRGLLARDCSDANEAIVSKITYSNTFSLYQPSYDYIIEFLMTGQRLLEISETELRRRYYADSTSPSGLRMKIDSGQRNRQQRLAGDHAGWKDTKGYWVVGIGRTFVKASRIVWILTYGQIPEGKQVDHKDGNHSNNNPINLQLLTNAENIRAINKLPCTSTSGFMGVSWRESKQMWRSYFTRNGKRTYFGYFDCPIKAAKRFNEAAIEWAKDHGETPRYLNPV